MKIQSPQKVLKILGIVFSLIGLSFLLAAVTILTLNRAGVTQSNPVVCFVFTVDGLMFSAIGISFLVCTSYQKRLKKRLIENGKKIIADVEDVVCNHFMTYNRHHPYIIHCAWRNPDDGITYHFRSEPIMFNPGKILQDKKIVSLPVYIDQNNIKKYYVGIDAVEENNVFL